MKTELLQGGSDLVDLHVLTHAGTVPDQLERCLDSLRGQPVNLYLIENDGSLLDGRLFAYAQGDCSYVSYVDADDFVESLVDVVAEVARLQPKALFTKSWTRGFFASRPGEPYSADRENRGGPSPFQLVVYRRDYLAMIHQRVQQRAELAGRLAWACDLAVLREVSLDDGWTHFDAPVYHWQPSANGLLVRAAADFGYVAGFYDHERSKRPA